MRLCCFGARGLQVITSPRLQGLSLLQVAMAPSRIHTTTASQAMKIKGDLQNDQRGNSPAITDSLKHHSTKMLTDEKVKDIWRMADCVCFDVDSTVCMDEAIDELARFLGVGDQVSRVTRDAMSGGTTFKESLSLRLKLINPSINDITDYMNKHPPKLTPGIRDLVTYLHSQDIDVYLISGGFHCVIQEVAKELNIPKENIHANRLKFYFTGEFAGFDESEPTCAEGGKPKVIEELKRLHGYQRLVHIGDGATDMEACPPADAFIGFGGNQIRENVRKGAAWFVTSFKELLDELQKGACGEKDNES